MTAMIDDYRWLVSDAATPWLEIAREGTSSPNSASVALISRLRKDLSPQRAHLVLEQIELRNRAREKFTLADKMYFTRKGLEQATDGRLAQYKASRFPLAESIVDLCCGIGGDLLALAARGPAIGADRDPVMALLARANAAVHGYDEQRCSAVEQDAADCRVGKEPWHCDPDRRATGRRATRVEFFEPPLATLDRLRARCDLAGIKLAPATEAPEEWRHAAELEWLSSRGECRQQVAWFGSLARHPGHRAATVVATSGATRTIVGDESEELVPAGTIDSYIYEPAAAVLAAKLTGALCREHALATISPGIAYLTSDQRIDDIALDGFEVIDVLPLDRKQLKAYCREHRLGKLEIKKRGVDIDPEHLRKEIAAQGDDRATIIIAPVAGKARAVISRRFGANER